MFSDTEIEMLKNAMETIESEDYNPYNYDIFSLFNDRGDEGLANKIKDLSKDQIKNIIENY